MMNGIKWIFFDIGSTLVDESVAFQKRIELTIAGTDITYDEYYDKMIELSRFVQQGYHRACEYYGLKMEPWHSELEFIYPESEVCLKTLRERYKIGILANQVPGSEKRLEEFGLRSYIDLVIASAEEGFAKPDLRLFEIALKKAGCTAGEAMMVGDRIDNDILPANRIGMTTVWIRRGYGRFTEPEGDDEQPDYMVEGLDELVHLLNELR